MGVKLPGILPVKTIEWEDLQNKKIGVDFLNSIYQFLSSIRQRDGTPLMDSHGNVTSHLSGLFYRSVNLMSKGIKLAYIFDGKAPALKAETHRLRRERKQIANQKYEKAKEYGDEDLMHKYSKQRTYIDNDMIKESKELLQALGLPVIQAPQEADAQGSFMVEKKDLYAFASSDADCLLHGCPRTITNLTLSQTRKVPGGKFVYIKPQFLDLKDVLKHLNLKQDQLIVMGILTGTDYNPKGIPGIGPKKSLNLVHQNKKFDDIFKELKPDFNWKKIYAIFKSMPVMKNYQLTWKPIDVEKVNEILVDKHEFSQDRIDSALSKIKTRKKEQSGLDKFI